MAVARAETDEAGLALDRVGQWWWLYLVAGICWFIFGFIVLSARPASVAAIAIFAGAAFIAGGVIEATLVFAAPSWRWLHAIFAILFIGTGIWVFAWPGKTFVVLAALIGWYLLFLGTLNIVVSLANRDVELWWMRLVAGIGMIVLAFWSIGAPRPSAVLLILWVGIAALSRGITDIILAFQLRHLNRT
jgi:uncharacterized membrane protein HdeD (DUF308 family)